MSETVIRRMQYRDVKQVAAVEADGEEADRA